MTLTPIQAKVASVIRNTLILRGCSPGLQAIADVLGTSKATVFEHVARLKAKGIIRGGRYQHGLALVDGVRLPDECRATKLPYLGEIA